MKKISKEQKPLKGFGVRVDAEQMKEAHALGIDTGELFRQALKQELMRKSGKCPTCGHKKKLT